MGVSKKWLILWSLWMARMVRQPTVSLKISNGWVRGSIANDGSHEAYLAIPYATVRERFQAPGPEPVWEDVFEAVDENRRCRQLFPTASSSRSIGFDNCLIANIYRPLEDVNFSKHLPVMVFIHGGGYFQGSATPLLYGPHYFMKKGVILVTINYRLNIQGFLCLRIKEAPGNAGMKDQVAALRWIQRNIRAFGGDPNSVTIFGESAGAASVSYLTLSPMAKGLFHKAIQESGSALSPWAYQFKPVYMASLLARTMGYNTQDPHKLYNYFMEKSNLELIATRVPRKKGNSVISEILYSPCVEDLIEGEEPFLTEIPYDILSQGKFNKVPMIIGSNNAEGALFVALENDTTLPVIDFGESLSKDLLFPTAEEKIIAGEKAKRLYLGDAINVKENISGLEQFVGEQYFNFPNNVDITLRAKASNTPVYSYQFVYEGWRNLARITGKKLPGVRGAWHADEIFYLFSTHFVGSLRETKIIDIMTTLWTNFAKYGDPTPPEIDPPIRWPRVDPTSPQSLVINSTLSLQPLWAGETIQYWRDLYSKYRRKER